MPHASTRLPRRITLCWGHDRLEVDDPIWIAKIVQELAQTSQPDDDFWMLRCEPYSRMNERIDSSLAAHGLGSHYVDPNAPPKQIGYRVPEHQGPVAAEALRAFLGVELPVALNFTSLRGRSEHRMSAVHTAFRRGWLSSMDDELSLSWIFNGYQLYANHYIGTAHHRPHHTDTMGHIERRLLDGNWARLGFDGVSTPPIGRHWSWNRRNFVLTDSGVQRVEGGESDLESEHNDYIDEEDEIPPSEEVI